MKTFGLLNKTVLPYRYLDIFTIKEVLQARNRLKHR